MFVFSYKINRHTWTEFIHLSAEAALSAENQCQLWKMSEGLLFFQQHIYYSKSGDIVRSTNSVLVKNRCIHSCGQINNSPLALGTWERKSWRKQKENGYLYTVHAPEFSKRRKKGWSDERAGNGYWFSVNFFSKASPKLLPPPPLKNNFLQQEKKILSKLMPTRKGESKNVSLIFLSFFFKDYAIWS